LKQAVLIGAGHAHLRAIRAAGEFRRRGHALTIVAPGPFWYSGLATGMLGGLYPPELDCIDVAALAARGGARFVEDRLVALDRRARQVILEQHGALPYDALSLNLGSAPPAIPGSDQPGVYSVKPIHRLRDLRAELERRFRAGGPPPRIVIAGAGVTGAELAANLAQLAARHRAAVHIVVIGGGDRALKQLPTAAAARVQAALERRGIRFRMGARVDRIGTGQAMTEDGREIGFDVFLNATGLRPAPVLAELGLPLAPDGGLLVDAHLRSPADPRIHGGGDCIALDGHALPRIGVYAIRQAPILLANLLASLDGAEPRRFEPQKHYLWIMNLGDGTGLGVRGRLWWHGRAAFRLKDWIDRRFLASYRDGRG
jgi:NADH dehydrogenase FAD-containing subunit